MKRITNPDMRKIAIILILPVLILLFPSLFEQFRALAISIYVSCVTVFIFLAGYHCIRQKCYAQLAIAATIVILLVAAMVFMLNVTI